MALLTFITAQQEVAAQLGLDYTDTNTATLIKRWLNSSYKDIVGYYNWSWLQGIETIVTKVDYTSDTDTTTVSITAGSTTITFSGAPAASQTNRYIQFSSADDWYLISAHTAAATTATISPAYIQSDNLSAGTFTIRTRYYSLASTTDKVYSAQQAITKTNLKIISASDYDKSVPYSTSTGKPYALYMWGQDSDGYWQITPFPFPDSAMLIDLKIKKKATDLSADSSLAIFPERFESAWLDRAIARGHEHNDDDRASAAFTRSMRSLEQLKLQDIVDLGRVMVLKSIDEVRPPRTIVPFPPEFGEQP